RRIAEDRGGDLAQVTPSGPASRVTKGDVERYLGQHERENNPTPTPTTAAPSAVTTAASVVPSPERVPSAQTPLAPRPERREERIKMSRRRRTIAQRMLEASQTTAMLTT